MAAAREEAQRRALIVGSDAACRSRLTALADQRDDLQVVGATRDGPLAVELAQLLRPDVIIVDVSDAFDDALLDHVRNVILVADDLSGPRWFEVGTGRQRKGARDSRLFGLSTREVEVMELIAAGRTNPEIAGQLFVAEKTVKNHVNRIYSKIGADCRSSAITLWRRIRTDAVARTVPPQDRLTT